MKTLREYIDILESLDKNVDEGIMKSLATRIVKGAANRQTPQEIANMHVRALNQRAPGTRMQGHPNFADFKREVHSYVSSADNGGQAFARTTDDHVKSLFKKYFSEGSQDLDETQQAEADPVARIEQLTREIQSR